MLPGAEKFNSLTDQTLKKSPLSAREVAGVTSAFGDVTCVCILYNTFILDIFMCTYSQTFQVS